MRRRSFIKMMGITGAGWAVLDLPYLLASEAAGIKAVDGMDGFSFLPLLSGKRQRIRLIARTSPAVRVRVNQIVHIRSK